MNNKIINILLFSIIIVAIFPLSAIADTSVIKCLKFSEIESLIPSHNSTAKGSFNSYDEATDIKSNGITAINGLLAQWSTVNIAYAGGDGTNPKDEAAISYLLNAQKTSLQQQLNSFADMDINKTALNVQKGTNSLIWNMEMIYISYNAISIQLEDLLVKKSLAERQLQIAKMQDKIGMATDLAVAEAEYSVMELESNVQKLVESKKSIIQQFNINLDQEYDTELVICDVPDVTANQISDIKVDDDYLAYQSYSYDVKLDANSDSSKRKFKNDFYRTYQTILDKQKALKVEQKKLITAEKKLKVAQLKYDIGSISLLQLELEKSAYSSQKSTTEITKDTLAQAYRQYEWAKKGLIVSSVES
ncbi:hypothetical protein [Dehalobacter sp. TeCB1]|uniref:hypothetical protein n=1 Tax=Dehalobacter sp. TeCB1 TaxID=1843715 RepID=UPI00083A63F9|nr:hypothetical protein [Dehalobacter sp. TeCB1]OCZ50400.1 hypothetical protein A7D23_15305 [Dehalobacter sp. TeCB1]